MPLATVRRDGRDAGDDGRQRRDRQARVEVADALGAWIGRQRPELAVGQGALAIDEDLRVAPDDPQTPAKELELARRGRRDGGAGPGCGRERVDDGFVVRVEERVLVRGRPRAGEWVRGRLVRPEIVEERVRGADRRGLRRGRLAAPSATRDEPPSTRVRRPPNSRRIGGRTPDRHTAERARTSGHP